MQKYNNNEYNNTKKMLNVLRKLNESKIDKKIIDETKRMYLIENDGEVDVDAVDDSDVKISLEDSNEELDEDEKYILNQITDNFKKSVSSLVKFDPGYMITNDEVRLDGNFNDLNFGFVLIVGDKNNGVYINAEMVDLTDKDETIETLTKLKAFYEIFKTTAMSLIEKLNNKL